MSDGRQGQSHSPNPNWGTVLIDLAVVSGTHPWCP